MPQLLDAVLRGSEMISVKNLDAIARQQWGEGAAHRRDDRLQPFCRGADHRGRDAGLEVVEFVIDRLERHANGLGTGVIGGVDGGLNAVDHQAHQVNDRGEEERARVLEFSSVREQFVQEPRRECVFQKARTMTETGLSWTNRSKTSLSSIRVASLQSW